MLAGLIGGVCGGTFSPLIQVREDRMNIHLCPPLSEVRGPSAYDVRSPHKRGGGGRARTGNFPKLAGQTVQKCRKVHGLGCVTLARDSRNLANIFSCISVHRFCEGRGQKNQSKLYSARPQYALLEIEQRAALCCTSSCSPVLPSNPFPVGHPAVWQIRRHTIHASPLTKCRVTTNSCSLARRNNERSN